MRITNIDTLSAYFDRLITENIKLYFFSKDGLTDKVDHQKETNTGDKIKNLRAFS